MALTKPHFMKFLRIFEFLSITKLLQFQKFSIGRINNIITKTNIMAHRILKKNWAPNSARKIVCLQL